jgi:hypothetical protein
MNADFLDLLTALSAADARFLVVGGYALNGASPADLRGYLGDRRRGARRSEVAPHPGWQWAPKGFLDEEQSAALERCASSSRSAKVERPCEEGSVVPM